LKPVKISPFKLFFEQTWRIVTLEVEPNFDGAEREWQNLLNLFVSGKTGTSARKKWGRVEEGPAALLVRLVVRRREEKLAMDFAECHKTVAP